MKAQTTNGSNNFPIEEPCGFVSSSANMQSSPSSPCTPTSPFSGSIDPNVLAPYPPVSYNIQIWINNKSDGTNNVPYTIAGIEEKIGLLNQQFALANICFNLVAIDTLNHSATYGSSTHGEFQSWAENNGYHNSQAINLYLYHGHGRGSAAGIDANIDIYSYLNATGIIGHEVGHLFGLLHTHGRYYDENASWWTGPCEHVTRDPNDPDFNVYCLNEGDKILDTNAVPDFMYEHKYEKADSLIANFGYTRKQAWDSVGNNFEWHKYVDTATMQYIGHGTDCQGTPFTITPADVSNLMGYSYWRKMDTFSIGQAIRMREYINYDPTNKFNAITNNNGIDLYIADSKDDIGAEPDSLTGDVVWNSPDIWVRNNEDGIEQHQNPIHYPFSPNYVYVRITNKACTPSSGAGKLKLYWAKANTALNWPYYWHHYEINNVEMADTLATLDIPIIQPGEEVILHTSWPVPDPSDYFLINSNPWHFCLLARIESSQDTMTYDEGLLIGVNTRNNNNIAWKNLTVIDLGKHPEKIGGVVAVGNPFEVNISYELKFFPDRNETGKALYEEAELKVEMGPILYQAWLEGGGILNGMVEGSHNQEKIIISEDASLQNIKFDAKEYGTLYLSVNFLTEEVSGKPQFVYHVSESSHGIIVGGETYEIRRDLRNLFYAQTNQLSTQNDSTTYTAVSIGEPAVYNWYDPNGNLIYSGTDLTLQSDKFGTYTLEITADADGYKDYKKLEIISPFSLKSITPNPANNQVVIEYEIGTNNVAFLTLTNLNSTVTNNYLLDETKDKITLDISTYPTGTYVIALICNGQATDSKNLIIQ